VHLRAIKLRGFKSFVDPVELRLEPGVGVIVGPNGSGKSNISDAILWATGSLSPSELRAERPDDVLFAGSASSKPADYAEVELLFDNADGDFPNLEFSEISVARRLHRGGEGQYLVNKAAVRRLDLVELLSDVGLGGGLRSIISQGKVEQVLASKPEERRMLIEEAAGLGRFKRRKHRSELKLARVALQAERARDLEDEVRKRLRPLALQATAAERAEKLAGEIRKLRAAVAALDVAALEERIAEADGRKTAATLARRNVDAKLEALLSERNAAEEELADAAGGRESATAALYRLRSGGERVGLRRESAQALLERLRVELEGARGATPAASAELERNARQAGEAARAAAAARDAAAAQAGEAWARVAGAERVRERQASERLEAVLLERGRYEEELAAAAGGREGATAALYRLRSAAERIELRRESLAVLAGEVRAALGEAESEATRPGPLPEQLGEEADAAEAAARETVRERDTLAERARGARERLAALEQSLAEREGIPPAARALAEEGERLALSLLEVEPGSERAVAAALGPRASALVAQTAQEGFALLERARTAGLGSLLVLIGRQPRDLVGELPVVPADQLLVSPVPVVTPEGYGFDPERGELWFAGETAEAVLLELDARRKRLAAEAESLERELSEAEQAASRAETRAGEAAAAYAEVAHLRRARRAEPAILRRLLAGAERLDEALASAARRAAGLEEPLREQLSVGAGRTESRGAELRRLSAAEAGARQESGQAAQSLRRAEQTAARFGREPGPADDTADAESAAELARSADEAAARAEELHARAREASTALAEAQGRASRNDPLFLERLVAHTERLDGALASAAAAADRFEAPLRARVDAGAQRVSQLGAELQRLGAAEVDVRRAASEAGERGAAIDVELARLQAEREEASGRLEAAGLDAAGAEPAEADDRDVLAEKAERLERRREQLGQVNPLAKEEYDAERERLDELATQRADLEQSLKELEQLAREAADEVERRFAETFDAVQEHFSEVAATLFPGGEGRLRLTEPDDSDEPGESSTEGPGVEVELRPAGKRITRLSLLSGGEKALGAISFLFALFLARPCPFYLLDEVEAALDDTNIGRFVELLRRYADRAQFIVITHQKRTMEAADILYGVTMGGEGISQIVSRRLPREEQSALSA
jgi:chromosome segregation protein